MGATIANVRAAWRAGREAKSGNVRTDGVLFYSYQEIVGYRDGAGRRVARVGLKISVTTTQHANALLRMGDVIAADLQAEQAAAAVICDWYLERGVTLYAITHSDGEPRGGHARRAFFDMQSGGCGWDDVPRWEDGPPCPWLPWPIVQAYAERQDARRGVSRG